MAGTEQGARSFDDLYERARTRLAGQLYALTGDWAGSCDFVQEAFVRCWLRWDRIASYDDPEAYVRRVAYNLAKSKWRRSRRDASRPVAPDRTTSDPDADVRLDLLAALRQLGVAERTALALHYLGGLSVEEVATEMDAPAGTVKSWLSRGRTHLAGHLRADRPEAWNHQEITDP